MRVVHLTTVHSALDTRIFHKEAKALVDAGYDVLLVTHHEADETLDGVQIESLGTVNSRVERWQNILDAYRKAKALSADVYHFHDPELLPVGVALAKRTHGKVIYDIHENYEAKILKRPWIPNSLRPILSRVFPSLQRYIVGKFDAVVTATDWIAEPLRESNVEYVVPVRNFPLTEGITISDDPPAVSEHDFVLGYVGGLRKDRGLFRMLRVLEGVRERGFDVELWLIGPFHSDTDEQHFWSLLQERELQEYVRTFGRIDYTNIFDYLAEADLGLAILDPEDSEGAIPTKVFDYLYSNLPTVASELAATRKYLPADCGTTVPYEDTQAQVDAVVSILDGTSEAVGTNGRDYIEEEYNWQVEKERLLDLYDSLS